MRTLIFLLLLPFVQVAQADEGAPDARKTFESLKSLVGDWESTDATNDTTVNYRLIANDTTLIETWTMSPTRQSMTVYTLDGSRLIATHYCPQGNAPRLAFTSRDETGASHFLFFDGANLQNPAGAHEHAFWVRIESPGELTRSETYIGNADRYDPEKHAGQPESFRRVPMSSP